MERIQVYLPAPLLKKLRAEAEKKGLSLAEVIRLRLMLSCLGKMQRA